MSLDEEIEHIQATIDRLLKLRAQMLEARHILVDDVVNKKQVHTKEQIIR